MRKITFEPKRKQALLTRRRFLEISSLSVVSLTAMSEPILAALKFIPEIENPSKFYPDKDWEKIYRSQFKYDSTFHFLCAPNDTHNCLLKAYVKNGVITRIGPSYGYSKAKDVYGNLASSKWEPRLCQKGLALTRRIQGPRRVKFPIVREGFKKWVEAGFPREEDGRTPKEYFQRGKEGFLRVSWEEIFEIAAKALVNIATTYTGEKGKEFLRKQGYQSLLRLYWAQEPKFSSFVGGCPFWE